MAEYASAAGFRAAVEAKLRQTAHKLGVPSYIVRRQAALERLLVRLGRAAPGRWAVKGGFALETRLGDRARASLDLDADHAVGGDAAREDLQRAAIVDLGDHFAFAVTETETFRESTDSLAIRYHLESSLAGRPFEPIQVDVTDAPQVPWDAQPARRLGLLAEFGFEPIDFLLVPLERQAAEKLHAYTRTYRGGPTTRVRDLVDLLLVRQHENLNTTALVASIVEVFARRATHAVPASLPPPPGALAVAYRKQAERVGLSNSMAEAHGLLSEWLNPVLAEIQSGRSEEP